MLLVVLTLILGMAAPAAESRPNIVLLFADDLGSMDVGYQGGRYDTPHIDRLASEGMRFTRAYAASPTCSPSRASVVTGRHPAKLQIVRHVPTGGKQYGFDRFGRTTQEFHVLEQDPAQAPSRNWLPLEETTMAEALKPLGYYAAFVGKWHLGHEPYHPIHQGFDEQHGVSNFGHPGSYYPPYWRAGDPYEGKVEDKYLTDRLADDAEQFLESYNGDHPFLLTVFFYNVHTPHQGRRDLVTKYEQRGLEGRQAQFGAMLEAMDAAIGRIVGAVGDDTLVVFFSDQGGWFSNAPLRGGKTGGMALYEGGARVPLLVRWPGRVEAGSVSEELALSTDLFPTFVELAGGDPRQGELDGVSLVPVLTGTGKPARKAVLLWRHYEDLYAAVIQKDWKLVASWK
ncbi:MAG: sulfatase, partial [bacterium]|nr:sulfatase [bacterium]